MPPLLATTTHRSRVAAAVFVVATMVVGAFISIRLWQQQVAYLLEPYSHVAWIVIPVEIVAYLAVLLWQSSHYHTRTFVVGGVGAGMIIRAGQSGMAALVASPDAAKTFPQAFVHYYVRYPAAAVLQLALTAFLLWLIADVITPQRLVLAPQPAEEGGSAQAPASGPTTERRRELVAVLMDREQQTEQSNADEPPETSTHGASDPDETEDPGDIDRPRQQWETKREPAGQVDDNETRPPDQPTDGGTLSQVTGDSNEAGSTGEELKSREDVSQPGVPRHQKSAADSDESRQQRSRQQKKQTQQPAKAAGEPPKQAESGTARQDSETQRPAGQGIETTGETQQSAHPAQPKLLDEFDNGAEPHDRHDDDIEQPADDTNENDSDNGTDAPPASASTPGHGMFTQRVNGRSRPRRNRGKTRSSPEATDTQIAEVIRPITFSFGLSDIHVASADNIRTVVLAGSAHHGLAQMQQNSRHLAHASKFLTGNCGIGDFNKVLIHPADLCIGGVLARSGEGAVFVVLIAPTETETMVLDLTLEKIATALGNLTLPKWRQQADMQKPPAYPDNDLQQRLQPALQQVPQIAGLNQEFFSVGGRQIVMLDMEHTDTDETASAVAAAFDACELMTEHWQFPDCEYAIWNAADGTISSASTKVRGQRVLICRVYRRQTAIQHARRHINGIVNQVSEADRHQ